MAGTVAAVKAVAMEEAGWEVAARVVDEAAATEAVESVEAMVVGKVAAVTVREVGSEAVARVEVSAGATAAKAETVATRVPRPRRCTFPARDCRIDCR